jgi:hypothetical protein
MTTLSCACNDQRHDVATALWHRAYIRWYDCRDQGREIRAAAWGWLADRLVRFVR